MTDLYTIIATNLSQHGYADALERATEIELEFYTPKKQQDPFKLAFEIVSKYYPTMAMKRIYNRNTDTFQDVDFIPISENAIRTQSRKRELVNVRQICISIIKRVVRLSHATIGQYYGGRDHSTSIHSIYVVNDQIDVDREYREKYNMILKEFKMRWNA
jgi:hypothetical protein